MPVGNVTAYYTNTLLEQGITNGMFVVENTSVQLKTNECPFYHGVLNGTANCSENLAIADGPRGYNWPILFLTPLIFFGVGGNILVCMAISLEKRLQSVTNYFLLSLAITDLLVCIIVMPFTVINDFAGKEYPPYSPKPQHTSKYLSWYPFYIESNRYIKHIAYKFASIPGSTHYLFFYTKQQNLSM